MDDESCDEQQDEEPAAADANEGEEDEDDDDDDDDDSDGGVSDEGEKAASDPTANLPPSPASTAGTAGTALTVIVPGRAALLREQGLLDAAWGSSVTAQAEGGVCGCVSVLDDKGTLEFNTEDVAALLTLALGRVHPFMPLAARITAAAEEAGWDGGAGEEEDGDDDTLDARVWAAVQQYTLECRAATDARTSSAACATAAIAGTPPPAHLFSSPVSSETMPPPPRVALSSRKAGRPAAVDDAASPGAGSSAEEGEEREGGAEAEVAVSVAVPGNPTTTAGLLEGVPEGEGSTAASAVVSEVQLTVDEAADLLEFVAAARFIAQIFAEPVVAAGVSAGRWSCAMRLAEQVRKLAEEEQQAQQVAPTAAPTSSLNNMLCLGALADVQGLGLVMAQQARYAPALEAVLKRELRQALRRGQGLKRRIRHRLQIGAPDVFSFPMIMPACQLANHV